MLGECARGKGKGTEEAIEEKKANIKASNTTCLLAKDKSMHCGQVTTAHTCQLGKLF